MQSYFVMIKQSNSKYEKYKLKEWLSQNPNILPGIDPKGKNTHTLCNKLVRQGWQKDSRSTEVHLYEPDQNVLVRTTEGINTTDLNEFEDNTQLAFSLEKDMQKAIRKNIGKLAPNLRIIDNGTEVIVDIGRIDILAEDENKQKIVIELKAGTAYPNVISQILTYMGALRGKYGQDVAGIIIANDFHPKTILAANATGKITLYEYSFQFAFTKLE